jgi:SAM-dependent methyltransferase
MFRVTPVQWQTHELAADDARSHAKRNHRANRAVEKLVDRFYRHRSGWLDGTTRFASLARKHLQRDMLVLDLGAGEGKRGPLDFRGIVKLVIGADPDSAIATNSHVDLRVVARGELPPFKSESFDVIFADWLIEHLPDPAEVVREVFRLLRPGGHFFFRTGNLRHYSYTIAAHTPHCFHQLAVTYLRFAAADDREHAHVTYYRMNTRRAVRHILGLSGFLEDELLMVEPEPAYLMFSVPSLLLGIAYERLVNRYSSLSEIRACLFGSFRKPTSD